MRTEYRCGGFVRVIGDGDLAKTVAVTVTLTVTLMETLRLGSF